VGLEQVLALSTVMTKKIVSKDLAQVMARVSMGALATATFIQALVATVTMVAMVQVGLIVSRSGTTVEQTVSWTYVPS